MYPVLTIVFIFIVCLALRFKYLRDKQAGIEEAFWNRELRANATPKRDITNLPYITIPTEKFPSESSDSDEQKLINDLNALSEKRILNLTGRTNTDLKEDYGVPNLTTMQEIGENFNVLCGLLIKLAEKRVSREDYNTALKYLEFGAGIKSDMSKNYILLGDCYSALGKTRKINSLIELVESMHLPLEHSIMESLKSHLPDSPRDDEENFDTAEENDTHDDEKES